MKYKTTPQLEAWFEQMKYTALFLFIVFVVCGLAWLGGLR